MGVIGYKVICFFFLRMIGLRELSFDKNNIFTQFCCNLIFMLFLDQKTEMANFFDFRVYDDTIVRYYNLIKTSCHSSYHRGV